MSEDKKILVNITNSEPNDKGEYEVVIREGEAEKLPQIHFAPVSKTIKGTISSVRNYLVPFKTKKTNTIEVQHLYELILQSPVITYSLEKGIISLDTDLNLLCGSNNSITGTLETHKDITRLKLGESMGFASLIKYIKSIRNNFTSKNEYQVFLTAVSNYSSTVTTEYTNNNDSKGNLLKSFEQKVKNTFPEGLRLRGKLFQGFDYQEMFDVEVEIEVSQSGPTYTFVSSELDDILEAHKEKIIGMELDLIRENWIEIIPMIQVS